MGTVQQINHRSLAQQPLLFLILRVGLGILLLLKGFSFLSNSSQLEEIILQSRFKTGSAFLVSYIAFAHLFGGVFIIIGLLTRWVVALQLPVLIGAVFFVNMGKDVFGIGSEFWLAVLVLALLILFLIKGAGPLSIDGYMKKKEI
jgi:putative oxidoreductase